MDMVTFENKGYKTSEPIADDVLREERREAGQMAATATGMPEYKSAADFDARFSKMLQADEEKERARKEKEIQRKQIAQSMSDLGAVFGDVIKASGGALVTPRDVQAKYDALDKQSQAVYDNYRARMDAMRKELNDDAEKDRDRALKAKENAEAWAYQWRLYAAKKAADDAKTDAERKWKAAEAEKDRKAKANAAYIRATGKKDADVYRRLTLNDGRTIDTTKADNTSRLRMMLIYMIRNGMVDVNNDALYKSVTDSRLIKKDNGEYTFEEESVPLVISRLSDDDVLETITHYLDFLDKEENDALYDTFGQKAIPKRKPTTTQPAKGTTTQPAETTATTPQPKQTSTGGLY